MRTRHRTAAAALACLCLTAQCRAADGPGPEQAESNHPAIVVHHAGADLVDVWKLRPGSTEVSFDPVSHAYRFYDAGGDWVVVGGDVTVITLEPAALDVPESAWFRWHEWHRDVDSVPYRAAPRGNG